MDVRTIYFQYTSYILSSKGVSVRYFYSTRVNCTYFNRNKILVSCIVYESKIYSQSTNLRSLSLSLRLF